MLALPSAVQLRHVIVQGQASPPKALQGLALVVRVADARRDWRLVQGPLGLRVTPKEELVHHQGLGPAAPAVASGGRPRLSPELSS